MQPKCIKCKDELAVWDYMPSTDDGIAKVYCNTCVPRGCACNDWTLDEINNSGKNIKNFQEIEYDKNEKGYRPLDENGKPEPCCEYMYSPKEDDWNF